jgi:uncharacterized protein YndB with AHSA1/START domain
MENRTIITVSCTVKSSIEKAWECWTLPEHLQQWNFASDDWHCPKASNDLRVGGKFTATMAAKDGSFSFDFEGTYSEVIPLQSIKYHIIDGREVSILFEVTPEGILITESFEAEKTHPVEMQQGGWQAILDNFKKYAEAQ